MQKRLNVLTVEDSEDDALLLAREFKKGGLDAEFTRVDTPEALRSALGEKLWDIVFCDYSMPHFSGMAALKLIREIALDVPVIFVSGTMGEDVAVEAMHAGANDYLMKDNLKRLVSAVERELRNAIMRAERKRAEESHARLATAVEQATETILITDLQGTIQYVNPAFEKISGYTRAEALGQNPRILKSGKQDAEFYRQMWDVLKRGEVWHGHFSNKRKDGTLYEEETVISPIRDTEGAVVNYVAIKRNVTHEVQLEAQFRQSQKMEAIGTLAGGVAHDFNNILAIIQMQADLLKSGDSLSPEQVKIADDISDTVDRAAALTSQLLLFSRKQTLRPRDLDLSQSITNMTKMLRRTLGENIEVQLNLAAQLMFVHADPAMLDQVLLNLAVNAHAAMPQGGQLVITTTGVEFDEFAASQSAPARPGSFVCLSVADTGCGIPPEILPRIFDPFFTTKDVGKGTGLGLATVFGIVQQHQGWINVYSEVGRGTTFKVYLPRLSGATVIQKTQPMPVAVSTGHETILLVEDESALRDVVQKTLAQLGYRVLKASTGVKAWKSGKNTARKSICC